MEKFFQVLFEPNDGVCFAMTPYDTSVEPASNWWMNPTAEYFTLNSLHVNKDVERETDVGRRCDANVNCYRNLLLEFDSDTLREQTRLIIEANLPHTTRVYSGGKSIHVIISLEKSLETLAEWKAVRDALYAKFPRADRATNRASNLTRAPGPVRRSTGKVQELIYLGNRVPNETLYIFLGGKPEPKEEKPFLNPDIRGKKLLGMRTTSFLKFGLFGDGAGRNQAVYLASLEILHAGYTEEECRSMITASTDLPAKEIRNCIKSAARKVGKVD